MIRYYNTRRKKENGNGKEWTVNKVGDKGKRMLYEGLMKNTTLTNLFMWLFKDLLIII